MVYERDIIETLYGPWFVVGDIVQVPYGRNGEDVRVGIIEVVIHEDLPVLISLEKGKNETEIDYVIPKRITSDRIRTIELRMAADLRRFYG